MTQWFGTDWGAPVCRQCPHVPVPVGVACAWCGELFTATDSGLTIDGLGGGPELARVIRTAFDYHRECFLRTIMGSVGHQLKLCACYGGDEDCEPETMTKRESAIAAFELAHNRKIE